jgi:hypothetical protein
MSKESNNGVAAMSHRHKLPATSYRHAVGYGVAETWRDFYPRSIENALAFLDGKPIRVVTAL